MSHSLPEPDQGILSVIKRWAMIKRRLLFLPSEHSAACRIDVKTGSGPASSETMVRVGGFSWYGRHEVPSYGEQTAIDSVREALAKSKLR